tara:strand:- start:434 stop:4141 length:3708 start_codon:yes stop_codon:yes gene_type:complete
MRNNNISKIMKNKFSKNTVIMKLVLCLFFGMFFATSLSAQNCQLIDSVIVENVKCYGDNDGSIDLVLLDPLLTYTFFWNNLEVTEDINNLSPGTYSVTITKTNPSSCSQDTSFTISQPQDPLSSTVNLYQDVFCYGDSTGIAIGHVIGGTAPYTYLWSNAQTSQVANGLWAGNHTITFTDTNGCTLADNIDIINLHQEIVGTIDVIQDVSCFEACDAIAVLSSTGGVLQHTYDWDISQTYIGSGPDTAFNLCYGGHNIIIEDGVGCRKTVSFTITQPDELFAQSIQVQPVQCYGFDDGISFASATGGTTAYSFVWDSINGSTGQDIDSLTPGIHTVYVTDENGCTASDTVVITEPTQLEVIIVDSMTIYSYCAGTSSGQLCALASGGTPGYNYVWNDAMYQTTPCATDIVARFNDYTIIVMDDRNCIATASFQLDSITNSMNPDSVIVTIDHVSCFGIYDGAISVSNVVGAVAPFTYDWTGGGFPPYTGSGDYISSLYAGSYAVIIEDSNGCAITVNAEVLQADQLEYTTYNVIGETCFGANDGQIWVNVNGGTGNYYYDFSEVGAFGIPTADQVQLINDSLILNLSAGNHTIYLTDDNNCEGAVVWGGTWVEKVDSGVVVSLTGVTTADASCFNTNDGQAWISYPGADPLFTYTWETDPIGTVIDTGINTSLLYPGNYNVVVHYTDSASFGQAYSGCDLIQSFTVGTPIPLLSNAIVTAESCFGSDNGSIILSPSSSAFGVPTVMWDTTTSIPGISTALSQSPLQPGTYTVTITDANGCEITEDLPIYEALALSTNILPSAPSCNGLSDGSADLTVFGGTGSGTYNINWSPSGFVGEDPNNLSAGINTVQIIDANNCSTVVNVVIDQPEAIIASVSPNVFYNGDENGDPYHISCFGFSDGSAIVTNGGGVAPITYSWSPSGGGGQIETGISAGLNTVTVTDANNCTETQTIFMVQPEFLDPNIFENIYSTSTNGITNEISCYGFNDGWVESQTQGGVPSNVGFQYSWVNDNTGVEVSNQALADNLTANTSYTVTVTDANGCVSTETSEVLDEPVLFVADVTRIDYAGPTHAPFIVNFVDATISNDPFDFNWTWEDGVDYNISGALVFNHDFVVKNIGVNNVYVIVTNLATSCFDSIPFVIDVQGIPIINNVFTPNNDGINDAYQFNEYAMSSINVQIYNRWGQQVYTWEGENKAWDGRGADGKNLPEAVYFYVVIAEGEDGYYYEKKGSVTLLR